MDAFDGCDQIRKKREKVASHRSDRVHAAMLAAPVSIRFPQYSPIPSLHSTDPDFRTRAETIARRRIPLGRFYLDVSSPAKYPTLHFSVFPLFLLTLPQFPHTLRRPSLSLLFPPSALLAVLLRLVFARCRSTQRRLGNPVSSGPPMSAPFLPLPPPRGNIGFRCLRPAGRCFRLLVHVGSFDDFFAELLGRLGFVGEVSTLAGVFPLLSPSSPRKLVTILALQLPPPPPRPRHKSKSSVQEKSHARKHAS